MSTAPDPQMGVVHARNLITLEESAAHVAALSRDRRVNVATADVRRVCAAGQLAAYSGRVLLGEDAFVEAACRRRAEGYASSPSVAAFIDLVREAVAQADSRGRLSAQVVRRIKVGLYVISGEDGVSVVRNP
jgi:hypothetical protein